MSRTRLAADEAGRAGDEDALGDRGIRRCVAAGAATRRAESDARRERVARAPCEHARAARRRRTTTMRRTRTARSRSAGAPRRRASAANSASNAPKLMASTVCSMRSSFGSRRVQSSTTKSVSVRDDLDGEQAATTKPAPRAVPRPPRESREQRSRSSVRAARAARARRVRRALLARRSRDLVMPEIVERAERDLNRREAGARGTWSTSCRAKHAVVAKQLAEPRVANRHREAKTAVAEVAVHDVRAARQQPRGKREAPRAITSAAPDEPGQSTW